MDVDNGTINLTPNTHWRIIGVNKINDISFFGITKEMTKLSIVLKSVSTKFYLHEWGHCYEPEVDGDNNWRHEKYPWYIHHYYNSYRWDENY